MDIIKYENHTSIKPIKNGVLEQKNTAFSFSFAIEKELKALKSYGINKSSQNAFMFVKIIKENQDLTFFLHHNFKNSLRCVTFPISMEDSDVKPIYNKDEIDKKNYQHNVA